MPHFCKSRIFAKNVLKKDASSHNELVLMFLNNKRKEAEILGSFNSHKKAAAGRISWFDPGVESLSRLLSYIFQDVSRAV